MTKVSVVGPAGGEVIQLGPTQIRILEDGQTAGHRLGMGEITLAPHTEGPPQHRHAQHDEGFYVVSGPVHFTVADHLQGAGGHPGDDPTGRPAHVRQSGRPASRAAEHLHPPISTSSTSGICGT